MNEQEKRELMTKAAVKFGGKWPDVSEDQDCLIVSKQCGEIRASMINSKNIHEDLDKLRFDIVCTRSEFEVFINSLFEGAPEDVEFYWGDCWYKKEGESLFARPVDVEIWVDVPVFDGMSLIPRPRKKPSFVGDAIKRSIDQAYNEAINKVPNTPTMNDHFADTNVGEWIPEVGQEFEWMLEGVSDKWHESYFIGYDKEGDMVIQRDTEGLDGLNTTKANHSYKFRPLPKCEPAPWVPEVGQECEYYSHEMGESRKGLIHCEYKQGFIVIDDEDEAPSIAYSHNLRPIRTEAEIECEELASDIVRIARAITSDRFMPKEAEHEFTKLAENIYALGYRKANE